MHDLKRLFFILTAFLLPALLFAEFETIRSKYWDKVSLGYNTIDNSVTKDVGCTKIDAPTGTIDSGQSITPACSVYNYGTRKVNYNVRMKIGDFYNQTASVSKHSPGTYLYVTFPELSYFQRGTHVVSCSTELPPDMNKANDKKTGSVFVRVLDVGCIKIVSPPAQVNFGEMVIPACSVYNYGNVFVDNYPVHMEISSYADDKLVEKHFPGTYQYVEFEPWWVSEVGLLQVVALTELVGDMNLSNNEIIGWVLVIESKDVGSKKISKASQSTRPEDLEPGYSVYNAGKMGSMVWIKTGKKETAILKIYSVSGKLIHSTKTDKGFFTITGLPTGTYILRLETKDQTEIRKLLVIR